MPPAPPACGATLLGRGRAAAAPGGGGGGHEYRISHPVGVDTAVAGDPIPATMRAYAMQGTPTLMLVDRQGRLRLKQFGRVDDLALGAEIMRLVKE